MHIKQQMLAQNIQKELAPLYILIGQDHYLLEDSLTLLKSTLKKTHDYEEKIISIHAPDDWNQVREEANSYSLFFDTILLNIIFDKKSIDAKGKKFLSEYLASVNSHCFIIIRAPLLPAKQLQWLVSENKAVVSIAYPFNASTMKQWIAKQLTNQCLRFDHQIPTLIHQYTQGNMLACAQVIEKIALCSQANDLITVQMALEQLSNQCDHNLYELIDACLLGEGDKVIQILRQAASNKTELTLVLWMFTQEIRLIAQLSKLLEQKKDLKSASAQLKIWPQRMTLYKASCTRLNSNVLGQLHQYCCGIDERIKSNFNSQIWNSLEDLALSLCLGKLIGETNKI